MSQSDFFEPLQEISEPYLHIESRLWKSGFQAIAGCDEAGRGPLAGPVVAAACILPRHVRFPSIKDSKQLSEEELDLAYNELTTNPRVIWAVSVVDSVMIDKINILRATLLAMKQAVEALRNSPDFVLIDGRDAPPLLCPYQIVIKGDSQSQSIAAASVLAKVTRDRLMVEYDAQFPGYGFKEHKGYGTKEHLNALDKLGPTSIHRRSFGPVTAMSSGAENQLVMF